MNIEAYIIIGIAWIALLIFNLYTASIADKARKGKFYALAMVSFIGILKAVLEILHLSGKI